jgi:hypothetical protein
MTVKSYYYVKQQYHDHHPPDSLIMPTISAISISTSTMSMQNL